MPVARVCRWCQSTAREKPCEHCGQPKQRTSDRHRGTSTERGYGWKWRQWRESIIRRMRQTREWDGNCDMCGKIILRSIHCDHIEPVTGPKDTRFYDRTNIQFLHAACHSMKTIEDKRQGKTRS